MARHGWRRCAALTCLPAACLRSAAERPARRASRLALPRVVLLLRSLLMHSHPARLLLLPTAPPPPSCPSARRGEGPLQIPLPGPPTFAFHHANAYEDPGRPGVVVLDSIHYDSLPAVGAEPVAGQQVDPDAGFRPKCVPRLPLHRGGVCPNACVCACAHAHTQVGSAEGRSMGCAPGMRAWLGSAWHGRM